MDGVRAFPPGTPQHRFARKGPTLRLPIALVALLVAPAALAAKPLITFTPPPGEERPLITRLQAGPQGNAFAFELTFDKAPWGETCRPRCANATVFVALDDAKRTGLQPGKQAKETGADLAVTVQGAAESRERGARHYLRVKVRQLSTGSAGTGDGEVRIELDHRKDPANLQTDAETVWILVNMSQLNVPSGRKARVIYHPPGAEALEASTAGMQSGSRRRNRVFRTNR